MTELLMSMLESEIFWKALGAAIAAVWSLPAVQWFRRELREHRMGILLDAAKDVGTKTFRQMRKQVLKGNKTPEQMRRVAVRKLRRELKDRAPRLLGKIAHAQLERLIDEVIDQKEEREARKPAAVSNAGPDQRTSEDSSE